jgi:hypothetical protein
MVHLNVKYNHKYKCYTILKQEYPFVKSCIKQFKCYNMHQLQAMFICYPTIYDMTMLALVSYMKILIEWMYPVYPDSILDVETFSFHNVYRTVIEVHRVTLSSVMLRF